MSRLYLVRHGAAEGAGGRAVGHTDLPLSAAGRRAVELLAASWQGPTPDRLLTSPLARAAESAGILAAAWGSAAPELDPRLAEMSFGSWDGRPWDEIHAADGDRLAAWADRWWEAATPSGEDFGALTRRVGEWLDELLAEGAGRPSRVTVAVTHAGPIRALLAGRLGVPRAEVWDQPVGLARVSSLAIEAGQLPRLVFLDRAGFAPPSTPRGPA